MLLSRPVAQFVIATLVLAGCLSSPDSKPAPTSDAPTPRPESGPVQLRWGTPVNLNGIGYEPSLVSDSTGALFITAHKDLSRPDTWPYLASWILVSTDAGKTWHAPASPANVALQYVGDEGDLAVDARDWLYYVDTYAADNHIHVWADQGKTWKYSVPAQRTSGADDRPWIFAQGQGVVHYLGNNGAPVAGARIFYYRSTDGGLTWTAGMGLPGAGWAQGAAQVKGNYAFLLQETQGDGNTDFAVQTSKDQGATWSAPVKAGHRSGTGGDTFPFALASGPDGQPVFVWQDVGGGGTATGDKIFLSRSLDHGATFQQAELTPFKAYMDHITVDAGAGGATGVAFYATSDLPLSDQSKWYIYGGVTHDSTVTNRSFAFQKLDPQVLYTGKDIHALHDFFEVAFSPDGAFNVAYMTNLPPQAPNQVDGDRHLWFVRGEPEYDL